MFTWFLSFGNVQSNHISCKFLVQFVVGAPKDTKILASIQNFLNCKQVWQIQMVSTRNTILGTLAAVSVLCNVVILLSFLYSAHGFVSKDSTNLNSDIYKRTKVARILAIIIVLFEAYSSIIACITYFCDSDSETYGNSTNSQFCNDKFIKYITNGLKYVISGGYTLCIPSFYLYRLYSSFYNSSYNLKRSTVIIYSFIIFVSFVLSETAVTFTTSDSLRYVWNEDTATTMFECVGIVTGLLVLSEAYIFAHKLFELVLSQRESQIIRELVEQMQMESRLNFSSNNINNGTDLSYNLSVKGSSSYIHNGELETELLIESSNSGWNSCINCSCCNCNTENSIDYNQRLYDKLGSDDIKWKDMKSKLNFDVELNIRQKRLIETITKQTFLAFSGTGTSVICFAIHLVTIFEGVYVRENYNQTVVAVWWVFAYATGVVVPLSITLSFSFMQDIYNCLCGVCHKNCLKCFQNITKRFERKQYIAESQEKFLRL